MNSHQINPVSNDYRRVLQIVFDNRPWYEIMAYCIRVDKAIDAVNRLSKE